MKSFLTSRLFLVPVIAILVGLVVFFVLWNLPVVRQKIRTARMFIFFKFAPSRFKKAYFRKLKKGTEKIYLLGTTHQHFNSNKYSLLDIQAVIKNLKPDLLLVESRPKELKQGNLGDGPPEMLFAHLFARSIDIPVKGVDWWSFEMSPGTTTEKRDDKMVDNILGEAKDKEKVLVLTGATHVNTFVPRLVNEGYEKVKFEKDRKEELFMKDSDRLVFPEKMEYYLRKRIQHDKELLKRLEDPEWKEQLSGVIKSFEDILATVKKEEGKRGGK
jgi:hypothetical protein